MATCRYLSVPLAPSKAFVGTGETFLFTLEPTARFYHWEIGRNDMFVKVRVRRGFFLLCFVCFVWFVLFVLFCLVLLSPLGLVR